MKKGHKWFPVDLLGMKSNPQLWGLFHENHDNKDPVFFHNQDDSMESRSVVFFFFRGSVGTMYKMKFEVKGEFLRVKGVV